MSTPEPPTVGQRARARSATRGSVLIIVLWVCLGLVALTVYFADTMSSEFQAAGNRADDVIARQAAAGGTRYAAYILSQFATNGAVPPRIARAITPLPPRRWKKRRAAMQPTTSATRWRTRVSIRRPSRRTTAH